MLMEDSIWCVDFLLYGIKPSLQYTNTPGQVKCAYLPTWLLYFYTMLYYGKIYLPYLHIQYKLHITAKSNLS